MRCLSAFAGARGGGCGTGKATQARPPRARLPNGVLFRQAGTALPNLLEAAGQAPRPTYAEALRSSRQAARRTQAHRPPVWPKGRACELRILRLTTERFHRLLLESIERLELLAHPATDDTGNVGDRKAREPPGDCGRLEHRQAKLDVRHRLDHPRLGEGDLKALSLALGVGVGIRELELNRVEEEDEDTLVEPVLGAERLFPPPVLVRVVLPHCTDG
eukprot:scaffold13088_cov56-Phaeocystis_antarctica.AAC.8